MNSASLLCLLPLLFLPVPVSGAEIALPVDTACTSDYRLEEVVVNPKSNSRLFEFPGAVTQLSGNRMEQLHLTSLKDAANLAPNVYIPDYGARLTSAVYIRGIGSRINSPAVGLSVDNVPYMDKSSFDFDLLDIEKVEFLRGPQGTLYGRNTMAGLINVYTCSPFERQGVRVKAGYGSYNAREAALSVSRKFSERWALSVSGQYRGNDGYFRNRTTGERADDANLGSFRARLLFRASQRLKFDLGASYEYSKQNGYPYFRYDKESGASSPIAYNDYAGYKRHLLNGSLGIQYIHDRYILNATTGYQFFDDRMDLDQDFTPLSIFTLQQEQRQHAFTQEVAFRSTTPKNLQWVAGVFAFYQGLRTDAPVTFKEDGVRLLIPASAPITNTTLRIPGRYETPAFGAAVFKQLSYDNLFTEGLTATVGLRLNYEGTKLEHDTRTTVQIQASGMPFPIPYEVSVTGKERMDAWELLPKFELKYRASSRLFAYGSIAKGYRSGGYNIQMFSDVLQAKLRSLGPGGGSDDEADLKELISYKPERSWNYEAGIRGDFLQKRLSFDLAVFYIDCRNQQISEFAENGYGRITKNTGKSTSQGVELTLRGRPLENLSLTASYGYTHATFRSYRVKNEAGFVDYKGNFVPFAPQHSLCLTADYTWRLKRGSWLDAVRAGVQYTGRGRIYWTEENDVSQPFYGLLNAEVEFSKGIASLLLWGRNITGERYHAFYFETLNAEDLSRPNGFAERGRPFTCGGTLRLHF